MINKLISKSKKTHLGKFFEGNYLQTENTWTKFNEILYTKGQIFEDVTLNENGAIITNQEIFESFDT